MIDFEEPARDLPLLRRTVKKAKKDKDPIPSLSDLQPKRDVSELIEIGRSWQKAGLGSLIEQSCDGVRSVSFTLNQRALEVIEAEDKRTWLGRLKMVPRSDWIALAALVVSLAAFFK